MLALPQPRVVPAAKKAESVPTVLAVATSVASAAVSPRPAAVASVAAVVFSAAAAAAASTSSLAEVLVSVSVDEEEELPRPREVYTVKSRGRSYRVHIASVAGLAELARLLNNCRTSTILKNKLSCKNKKSKIPSRKLIVGVRQCMNAQA